MNTRMSKNFIIILVSDAVLVALSLYFSHLLRFDFSIPFWAMDKLLWMLPYILCIKLFFFFFFDLYRGMWRYTSLSDLKNIIKAVTASTVVIIVFILYMNRFQNISRAVFLMDWCITIILITGLRLATRLAFEKSGNGNGLRAALMGIVTRKKNPEIPVLINGAGNCGERILSYIRRNI